MKTYRLDPANYTVKEAYPDMPEALVAYIKSRPEYDEAIFLAVAEQEGK